MTATAQAPGAYPGNGDQRRALRAIHTSEATEAVFHELHPQFEGQLPASVVRDYVAQAVADLQGSISREALPEMAIRLAAVRLERHLRPDHSANEHTTPAPMSLNPASRTHWSRYLAH